MRTFNPKPGDTVTFKGVFWNDHWEYDAPGAVYWPVKRLTLGGNSSCLSSCVESICCDRVILGREINCGWNDCDLREMKWRGWSKRVWRRKNAWHLRIKVRFFMSGGLLEFEIKSIKERFGPFPGTIRRMRMAVARPGRGNHG